MAKKAINKEIKKATEELKKVMQRGLALISDNMINQVVRNAKKLPPSSANNAIKNVKPTGQYQYKSDLMAAQAVIASLSLDQARTEVPKASKAKLMENEERLILGEFERLPPKMRKRIKAQNDLLVGTQIADLEKAIFFQYGSSIASEKSLKEIEADMRDKAEDYVDGPAVAAGAGVTSAKIVNESRSAFFTSPEAMEHIEAFRFVNGDPVSPICQDLAGTVFRTSDPNHFKYTPPLHFNCKSYIEPIIKLKSNEKIEKLRPSTAKIEDSIQFSLQNLDNQGE